MECKELCPLNELCDKFEENLRYKIDHKNAEANLQAAEASIVEDGEELESVHERLGEYTPEEALTLKSQAIGARVLESHASILSIGLDASIKARQDEEKRCRGPKPVRRFRLFGRIVNIECGSQYRKTRIERGV